MSWGFGHWGTSEWGTRPGFSGPPPGGGPPPTLLPGSPVVCEVEGGTIVTLLGSGFAAEFVPEVLSGPLGGPYVVEAEGYLWSPAYDLTPSTALPGMPALPAGAYSLRVRTPGGVSNVLFGFLVYKPYAYEEVVQKGRSAWSEKWRVGRRLGA